MGDMRNLKILSKKEIKSIFGKIKEQWGAELEFDSVFLMSPKNKIFIVNRNISCVKLDELRINNIGLYFGELRNNELRLSIEGARIVDRNATKNFVDLSKAQVKQWFRGEDIKAEQRASGFIILKHEGDVLGCGRFINGKILNFVPKARRVEVM